MFDLWKIKAYDELQVNYDKLESKYNETKIQCEQLWIEYDELLAHYKILKEDYIQSEKWREILKKRLNEKKDFDKLIEQPQVSLQDIENTLKFTDKITLKALISYLKIDSLELVKNITKVINQDNANETIQYLSWALARNDALVNMLSKFWQDKVNFVDKLKNEIKTKSK